MDISTQQFIFDTPLYNKVYVNIDEDEKLPSLIEGLAYHWENYQKSKSYDGYNPSLKDMTSYKITFGLATVRNEIGMYVINDHYKPSFNNAVRSVILTCSRTGNELRIFLFFGKDTKGSYLMKIGQYPSIADIHIGRVKQYDKVLDKVYMREYTKAIGLAANGVGIGSFVYLRRIFEKLIYDAASKQLEKGELNKDDFFKMRMDEKVGALRNVLPSFLVENKSIYGIISKGIHELSEQECLDIFEVMRLSIELILDEQLRIKEKEQKEAEAKKKITELSTKIKE